nr:hypothetical protein [Alphaproteobacteria bacterium]
ADELKNMIEEGGIESLEKVTWKGFLDDSFKKMLNIIDYVHTAISEIVSHAIGGFVVGTMVTQPEPGGYDDVEKSVKNGIIGAMCGAAYATMAGAGGLYGMSTFKETEYLHSISQLIEEKTQELFSNIKEQQLKPGKVSQVDWDKSSKERESAIKEKLSGNIARKKSFVDRFLGRNKKGPNRQR